MIVVLSFPTLAPNFSWLIFNSSISFLYDIAISIEFRFSLWIFSIKANSSKFLSSVSLINAGIVLFPISFEALNLLSPDINWNLSLSILLTVIGWIIPCCLIDRDNSLIFSSLNDFLGWSLFISILLIWISSKTVSYTHLTLPTKA